MRRKLIIANLKMYLSTTKSILLAKKIRDTEKSHDVILAPSFTALYSVGPIVAGAGMSLSAQNMYSQDYGAYTGEISASDLKELGCKYVILGHSERRKYFKETDAEVRGKIALCQKYGIMPIVCVSNESEVSELLGSEENFIVAYEPLTAIGTGEPESPEEAEKFSQKVKEILGLEVKVLYGGSVNSGNVKAYLQLESIEGVLVGGASLDIIDFVKIVN